MINDIINYGIRIIIILLGVVFLSGFLVPEGSDPTMMRIFGLIFVLFGIYRLLLYRANKRKYNFKDDEK